MLGTTNRINITACLIAGFISIPLAGPAPAGEPCTPEWAEDVGLPEQFVPRVWDLVAFDDGGGETLFAAGLLDVGPPDERTGAVRWNGQTWEALEIQGGHNLASSKMLTVYDGQLVGAGSYRIDDVGYRVARWDPGAQDWIPMSEPAAGFFGVFVGDAMVAFDGALYIGGRYNFDDQGLNSTFFSRFDGESWGPVPNLPSEVLFSDVVDLVVFDGALHASFRSFSHGSVFRLQEDGGHWAPVGGDVPSNNRMAVFQNQLYLAGTAGFFEAPVVDHVLRLESGQWEPIPSATQGSFTFIEALAAAEDGDGEALFIGGNIADIGGVEDVNHLARWDGENWAALGTGVSVDDPDDGSSARVMTFHGWDDGSGPALYVGGEFEQVGMNGDPIPSRGIARWSCEPAAVNPVLSEVFAAESAISSFAGTTRITVAPRDSGGELLESGQAVFLSTDAGVLLDSVMDQGDGTYRQDLQAEPGPAGAAVSAIVNGVEIEQIALVDFVPVDRSLSTIDVSIDETFIGGSAVVTVTPVDNQNALAGSGFNVQIATTAGELAGDVVDHGDGTYTQTVLADDTGTASITATVNGMTLNTSASLSVLDPADIGNVITHDSEDNTVGHLSIQAAIDHAAGDEGVATIFIAPGDYNETILLDNAAGLILEGLSAFEPVSLRGIVVSESHDVSIRFLTIDPGGAPRPRNAVELRGGIRASTSIEILASTIRDANSSGIFIGPDNQDVLIIDSLVHNNGRHGIETRGAGGHHLVANCTVADNGWSGIEIDRDILITLLTNLVSGNGFSFPTPNPNGYGIARARKGGDGTPEDVTLIQNVLENNNGRVQPGSSDSDIRNFDQVIDDTDDQTPYTD